MIEGIAEYIDIDFDPDKYEFIFNHVAKDKIYNTFGKTQWYAFSLEDNRTGVDTEYSKYYKSILDKQYMVHPYMQKRSTGFNYSTSRNKDLFIHTDVDYDTEHPKHFNLIIPIFGKAVVSYYKTYEEEIWLPELNAHGFAYYHEFKNRNKRGYKKFKKERKIGELVIDSPVLLDTNLMHGVEIIDAPRCAWCSRWNNIPKHHDFYTWKTRIEKILK